MLDSQRGVASPYAELDAILSGARFLLFDFDGPVCDLAGAMPADTAERLRRLVLAEGIEAPEDSDPFELLASSVAGRGSHVGAGLDAELASIELAAVAYVRCRDTFTRPCLPAGTPGGHRP